jgi:outer membrane protein assembly factor BamD (BamD/ComL family)
VAILLLALLTHPAAAQDFELDDSDSWIEQGAPEPGSPEARLAHARRALAADQTQRAEHLATEWIDRNPDHPLLPEAYLVRGDALMAQREFYQALFDYEYVARTFAGSEAFVRALEREYEIAVLFAGGLRRKLWGMRVIRAEKEAEELLIRIQERLPGSQLAERAGMTLADYYFAKRDMSLAAEMYEIFIENFPRSDQVRKARKRLIFAHFASFKGPEFDAAGLYEARSQLLTLQAVDPIAAQEIGADALMTRIDASEANKMLETARWYIATKDIIAAEMTIRRLIRRYPQSVAAGKGIEIVRGFETRLPDAVRGEVPDYDGDDAETAEDGTTGDENPQDATAGDENAEDAP